MKTLLFILFFAFSAFSQYPLPQPPSLDYGVQIARGQMPNTLYVNKFGTAPDIDTGDDFLTVWDYKADYTFSTTADITLISSDSTQDTTQTIEVQGLDANWDIVTQTATLNGQTPDTLDTPLIRVFRMKNTGSTSLAGGVYLYVDTATISNGKPSVDSNIRAYINNGNNQTLMAIYSVPRGYSAYMPDFDIALSKRTAGSSIVKMFRRDFGGVFQIKEITALNSTGTGVHEHNYPVPPKINEKTDIIFKADASANDIGVSAMFTLILIKD